MTGPARVTPAPALHLTPALGSPSGVVVVLHGGRENSTEPAAGTQPAALRMLPVTARVLLAGRGHLAAVRVRNTVRGWNSGAASPLGDLGVAMTEIRRRWGTSVPVCLVGHSMGGRAALRGAGDPQVRSVVGMAPWMPAGDPLDQLAGRQVLVVHGSSDRMTSPRASAAAVEALRARGERAGYVPIPGGDHALLRHLILVDGLVARFAAATLLGHQLEDGGVLGRALAG